MSFSFTCRGPNREDALGQLSQRMRDVALAQPAHKADENLVVAAAAAYLGILAEDPAMDVQVTVHGSVGGKWDNQGNLVELSGASVSVATALVPRAPAA